MNPQNRKTRDRAEKRGHFYELWSRRPLAGWVKSAANKLLSRRLERRRLKRDLAAGYPLPGYCEEGE